MIHFPHIQIVVNVVMILLSKSRFSFLKIEKDCPSRFLVINCLTPMPERCPCNATNGVAVSLKNVYQNQRAESEKKN